MSRCDNNFMRGYRCGKESQFDADMEVLEQIRQEIEQTAKDYDKFDDYRRVRGLRIALNIIDKYTKGDTDV